VDNVKFGTTGLGVSRLCIGCMSYGIPDRGPHPWTRDEEKSRPLEEIASLERPYVPRGVSGF
jgi:aryl-alcohol dehydrogenase-like predicted oxidoreductase